MATSVRFGHCDRAACHFEILSRRAIDYRRQCWKHLHSTERSGYLSVRIRIFVRHAWLARICFQPDRLHSPPEMASKWQTETKRTLIGDGAARQGGGEGEGRTESKLAKIYWRGKMRKENSRNMPVSSFHYRILHNHARFFENALCWRFSSRLSESITSGSPMNAGATLSDVTSRWIRVWYRYHSARFDGPSTDGLRSASVSPLLAFNSYSGYRAPLMSLTLTQKNIGRIVI